MLLGEFRKLTESLPDTVELSYQDPNFGGRGDVMVASDIVYSAQYGILVHCPFWESVEDQ